MHIDQLFTEFAQLGQRHRRAVDVRTAAAAGVDGSPHQQRGRVSRLRGRARAASRRRTRDAELGADLRARAPSRTTSASPRSPRASSSASIRIDLPAPVSPVSDREARREFEVERVDDDEVADRQGDQHSRSLRRAPRVAGITLQCSFLSQRREEVVADRMQQRHGMHAAPHPHDVAGRQWSIGLHVEMRTGVAHVGDLDLDDDVVGEHDRPVRQASAALPAPAAIRPATDTGSGPLADSA
jgi:hypothetical protein